MQRRSQSEDPDLEAERLQVRGSVAELQARYDVLEARQSGSDPQLQATVSFLPTSALSTAFDRRGRRPELFCPVQACTKHALGHIAAQLWSPEQHSTSSS